MTKATVTVHKHTARDGGTTNASTLNGEVHKTQTTSGNGINYHHGGERGNSWNTWKEAEMLLVPK